MALKPKLDLASFTGLVAQASGTTADADIDIARIVKRPQVRKKLGDLTELAKSVKAQGVLQPVLVHADVDGSFRLIAGERRLEAATLAGLSKIPALIKRNLSERSIRAMQVTENNDRADLTPYDQAMGVIEDVDNYGFQEAVSIWNRTDSWVSKRLGVKKYAEPVRELLQEDVCGDLEVLHSLNQLYSKSEKEFGALVERLRSGQPVSREDARGKLAAVKDWGRLGKERAALTAPVQGDAVEAEGRVKKSKAAVKPASVPAATPSSKALRSAVLSKAGTDSEGDQPAAQAREREQQITNGLREMLFDHGQNSSAHISSLQQHMLGLGYDPTEAEWVMWSGFLTVVLPVLEALGRDRALGYLRRIQHVAKGTEPAQLWAELHPIRSGEDPDDEAASRDPVPPKPDGWTF